MHAGGDILGQGFLERAQVRGLSVLGFQGFNCGLRKQRKHADEAGRIGIGGVEEELVELVGRGQGRVEPNGASFGFAVFGAVGFGDELTGQSVRFAGFWLRVAGCWLLVFSRTNNQRRGTSNLLPREAADEFGTSGDVAPLVAGPHLQGAIQRAGEVHKVVALQQLVAKLGVANAAAVAFLAPADAALNRVLGHHVVHG